MARLYRATGFEKYGHLPDGVGNTACYPWPEDSPLLELAGKVKCPMCGTDYDADSLDFFEGLYWCRAQTVFWHNHDDGSPEHYWHCWFSAQMHEWSKPMTEELYYSILRSMTIRTGERGDKGMFPGPNPIFKKYRPPYGGNKLKTIRARLMTRDEAMRKFHAIFDEPEARGE